MKTITEIKKMLLTANANYKRACEQLSEELHKDYDATKASETCDRMEFYKCQRAAMRMTLKRAIKCAAETFQYELTIDLTKEETYSKLEDVTLELVRVCDAVLNTLRETARYTQFTEFSNEEED